MAAHMATERVAQLGFVAALALLFALSAGVTVDGSASMTAMGAMPMPGGWTLSMAWMRMPGQSWSGTAASFVSMWLSMMVAMMLPSLAPMLWRYREAAGRAGGARLGPLTVVTGTAVMAVAYFLVWTVFGAAVFFGGAVLAVILMREPAAARAAPVAGGVLVLIAGLLQFTSWKLRHLACCRQLPVPTAAANADAAVGVVASILAACRHGLRLGFHCVHCCLGLTFSLLSIGMMNLPAMVMVAVALAAERLAPAGERVARRIGVIVISLGLLLIARAVWLG
jgi:predicted metal-binding membrane protein